MNTKLKRLKHEEDYILFLQRRLASANFKKKSSLEEYEKTKNKLKKSKFILRVLQK